jgi:hypothetical protein
MMKLTRSANQLRPPAVGGYHPSDPQFLIDDRRVPDDFLSCDFAGCGTDGRVKGLSP